MLGLRIIIFSFKKELVQKVLDAKKVEMEESADKKKSSKKNAKEDETAIIENYMQKKDDLEFRTLQELNKQMTK